MEDAVELGLEAAAPIIQNHDKVTDPLKERAKQLPGQIRSMRGQDDRDGYYSDDDYYDRPKHRSSRRDDREPREPHRSRGDGRWVEESYERKVTGGRDRARSVGRDGPYGGGGRGLDRDRHRRRYYSDSDSESSASPPPRKDRRKSLGEQALAVIGLGGGAAAVDHEREKDRDRERERERRRRRDREREYPRNDYRDDRRDDRRDDYRRDDRREDRPRGGPQDSRNKYVPAGYLDNGAQNSNNDGTVARRDKGGGSQVASTRNQSEQRGEKRSSSSSSSDVCSSSEDERRIKKARGKEFLTAGLAAVATIHAAQGVYKSMEARDKRHEEVAKGEISPEEARKMKNKARLQDAAAIGIAALGIKGAYSEWQEVQEHRSELAKEQKEKEERHEKRLRKAEKAAQRNGYGRNNSYRQSEPDLNRRYRD